MSMTGDFQTMQRNVMNEVSRLRANDADIVSVCICDAIEEYRWRPFHFNTRSFNFALAAGDNDYDLEALVTEGYLSSLEFWITHPDTLKESQVFECGLDEFRERQNRNGSTQSRPLDMIWHNNQMLVTPTPDANYTVVLDYIRDIGTPTYNWDAGEAEWDFFDDTGAALAPDYSNFWFTFGYQLIKLSAKRRVYESFLKDMEAAQSTWPFEERAYDMLSDRFRMQTPRRASWG